MAKNQRILQFDILRAVAILLVLLHHIPAHWISGLGDNVLSEVFWRFYTGGWIGVDMFFVLSGFLVSGIYFREYQKTGSISIGNFLIRRGFKIYPTFYFYLLVTLLIALLTPFQVTLKQVLGEVLFIQNYHERIWGPTWSLAVEEHFYILLTLFFWGFRSILKENIFRYVPHLFVVIALLCLTFRIILNINHTEFNFAQQYQPTHLRVDSLMFGVLIAYFYYFKPHRLEFIEKRKYAILTVAALSLIPYFIWGRGVFNPYNVPSLISTIGLTHQYLAFGLILVSFWNIPVQSNFVTRSLAFIGETSYASYLWHAPIIYWMEKKFDNFWMFPVYLAVTILVSYLSTKLLEKPMLNLRDRLFPSKGGMIGPRHRKA